MADKKTYHCFVYGTLKGMSYGKLLATGVTTDDFVMLDGGFPMVMVNDDPALHDKAHIYSGNIRGELYEINEGELQHLDRYEGTSPDNDYDKSHYIRKEVTIRCDDGVELTAWMYFGAKGGHSQVPRRAVMVPDNKGELSWR